MVPSVAASSWLIAGNPAEVMLLDGDLPGDAANRLCGKFADCEAARVIMLSFSSEPERIVKAFQAGAAAWVRKDESLEHLLQVIRGVARGESWLPPSETADVVQLLLHAGERHRQNERLLAKLTARERAVLACLAEGAAHREAVAKQLHLSGEYRPHSPPESHGQARRPLDGGSCCPHQGQPGLASRGQRHILLRPAAAGRQRLARAAGRGAREAACGVSPAERSAHGW